jgi:putative CocE/NonD family hydrolase
MRTIPPATVLAFAFTMAFFTAADAAAADSDKPAPVRFEWGAKIPLRDGVELNASVYRPREQSEPLPCIFTLTPYISASYHDRGTYFAANGYVFATVDVRGRGNSEGEFKPLLQEAEDGHDVVQWLARQPYCNGKVTMWGGSYAGYNQWAAAKEFPPALATIVPVASPKPGVDFPMRNNMFYAYDVTWLTFVSGKASQDAIFGDQKFWRSQYESWYRSGEPFANLDTFIGNPSPIFQEWISHPMLDAYWDSYSPTPEHMAKLGLPILSITGQYDGDQPGALALYRDHMRHGNDAAKARHYLIIGPWDHPGTRTPRADVGGLTFGEASLLDMNALHKSWYDWTMKGGAKPEFLKDKVAFYVLGEDAWRYAPSLEAVTASTRTLYLDSVQSRANDVFASGSLAAAGPGRGAADAFEFDPLDDGAIWLEDDDSPPQPLVDQRRDLAPGATMLVYHSAPFEQATDIAGHFRLTAHIELDRPDVDLQVAIHEIKVDGSSALISTDQMRARYRNSLREATLVTPGKIEPYRFDGFAFAAQRIARGSRLRLVIAPVGTMYAERNYHAGGEVARESSDVAKPVRVRLHHDRRHPSALEVPIAAASSVAAASD